MITTKAVEAAADDRRKALNVAIGQIEKSYGKFVEKDKLSGDDAQAALGRIITTTELDAAADADIVVEAVFESLDVKTDVFTELDRICRPDAFVGPWHRRPRSARRRCARPSAPAGRAQFRAPSEPPPACARSAA